MGTSAIIGKFMQGAKASGKKIPRAEKPGSRDTRDFIVNCPEQKTRWFVYVSVGLLIIVVIAFAVSSGFRSSEYRSGASAPASGSQVKGAAGAESPHAALHFDPRAQVQKVARSLAVGAEAEAAVEQAPAAHSIAFECREKHVSRPGLTSLSSSKAGKIAAQAGKMEQAADALMAQQVRELLSEVKSACENENKEALLEMLDQSDPLFHERYVADAERLFRRFDEIAVSFSGIEVSPLNDEEVLVKAHVRVEGAFALTGSWMVLSNSDQSFTLRKHSQSDWKLCAVNQ